MRHNSEDVEMHETSSNQNAELNNALYDTQSIEVESDNDFGREKCVTVKFMPRKYDHLHDAKVALENCAKKDDSSESYSIYLHLRRLYVASRVGNFDQLETLLNELSPKACLFLVDQLDIFKCAHLHYAVRYNNIRATRLLLNKGANPNIIGDKALTPLHYAARYCYEKHSKYPGKSCLASSNATYRTVISELIECGANIKARDLRYMTPLDYAAMRGNAFATRELLKSSKIDGSIYSKQCVTPLHYAAECNSLEVVACLLDAKADPEVFDDKHSTPLHLAAAKGGKEIVLLILESFEERKGRESLKQYIDEKDLHGNTALTLALVERHFEVVTVLLQKGADHSLKICSKYMESDQPLHFVASSGNVEIVKCLLEFGAEINSVDSSGDTPLHKAAAFNAAEVVEVLLENGSDIEARDSSHFTPLLTAVVKGHVEVVEKLLKAGANIDVVDEKQRSVLYWAAQEDHPALLRVLLKYGAETENVDKEGQTPLHIAAERGHAGIAQVLVNHSKFIVNLEDIYACTPLSLASKEGHYKVIKVLLDAGAHLTPCIYRELAWTPLHFAALHGWKRCCQLLLDTGFIADVRTLMEITPLHLAAHSGHKGVVKLLLKYGANIALMDRFGNNCLDLAIQGGHKQIALEILSNKNWETALRKNMRWSTDVALNTPIRKMIRYMPDIAEHVLDKCIANESHGDRSIDELPHNYEFIDDSFGHDLSHLNDRERRYISSRSGDLFTEFEVYTRSGRVKRGVTPYTQNREFLKLNHPLMLMVMYGREELLSHPLCKMLLKHKWRNYVRYVYFGNLLIFVSFLISLTLYVISSIPPCPDSRDDSDNCSTRNFTCRPHIGNVEDEMDKDLLKKYQMSIYVFAGLNLIKEVYQAYQTRIQYFNKENFLECTCYISALVFAADLTECSSQTGIREVWQWQLGSLSVFSAWMVLLVFIRKLPFLGIYVVMFQQILNTFLEFSVVFILFILAFAIAFFSVLQNQDPFERLAESIMKTSIMMIGEMEFDAIFNNPDNKVYFQGPAYFFFVLFLLFMSVILMNMLIGLAVDDIKEVQKKASLKRLAMEVQLVLSVEKVMPTVLLRKCIVRNYTKEKFQLHRPPRENLRSLGNTEMKPELLEYFRFPLHEPILKKEKVKEAMAEDKLSKLGKQLKDIQQSINILQEGMKNRLSTVQ